MRPVIYLESVNSTNEYLKSLSLAEDEWIAAVARSQTEGKGSKGRAFASPVGGLYMSVSLSVKPDRLKYITPMAAVAVRRAIAEEIGVICGIKWVNDLYYRGKKVCGILTETRTRGDGVRAVVGIGVDVYRAEDGYGEFDGTAGFLINGGCDGEFIRYLAEKFLRKLKELYDEEPFGSFMEEYSSASILTGKRAEYADRNGSEVVLIKEVNRLGELVILRADGAEEAVIDGDVKLKTEL